MGLLPLLLVVLLAHTTAAPLSVLKHVVHNPHNVTVTEVHLVMSSHFDAGCKTPGCTLPANRAPGEPDLCAEVRTSRHVPLLHVV